MIRSLLFISIAPILIVAIYIYLRDRYEKEPFWVLLIALLSGIIITIPVVLVETELGRFSILFNGLSGALYNGFIVASLPEEGFKFAVFLLIFWKSRNFNEKFDGIVYAVYISLGFALIENFIYVFEGGYRVGMLRALTAVPAHALFGIVMGYNFALAKFYREKRAMRIAAAFSIPFLWHGLYDFLLMSGREIFLLIFIPVLIFFWINGFIKMREMSEASVFRNDLPAKKS
jgi:RsiW-degrading membrane proteinase PrsW (M82 family)